MATTNAHVCRCTSAAMAAMVRKHETMSGMGNRPKVKVPNNSMSIVAAACAGWWPHSRRTIKKVIQTVAQAENAEARAEYPTPKPSRAETRTSTHGSSQGQRRMRSRAGHWGIGRRAVERGGFMQSRKKERVKLRPSCDGLIGPVAFRPGPGRRRGSPSVQVNF